MVNEALILTLIARRRLAPHPHLHLIRMTTAAGSFLNSFQFGCCLGRECHCSNLPSSLVIDPCERRICRLLRRLLGLLEALVRMVLEYVGQLAA